MRRWQRYLRWVMAVFAVVFAVFVARELRHRDPPPAMKPVARKDPNAISETLGGDSRKIVGDVEKAAVSYQQLSTFEDGSSKMILPRIVTDERNGTRTFTITGKEGRLGKNETTMLLDGAVTLEGSDGMTVHTEHATYAEADGVVRAPGPVDLTRGRLHATGIGMVWDKATDVLTILNQASVQIGAEHPEDGPSSVSSGTAVFARRDKYMRFEQAVRMLRSGQNIEAQVALMHLSADEKRIEMVELSDHARITSSKVSPGGLQAMNGYQINMKYAADGESLEHALIAGDASIQIAGQPGKPGRQIVASTIDITLAADGTTPTALLGRDAVRLTFPPEPGVPGRTISSTNLDAKGEAGKGLTRAMFTGGVQYRERGSGAERSVNSASLDIGLKPGLSSVDDARFARAVRFEEGKMAALSALGHYDPDKGTLALSGSEPGALVPHVVNEQIAVDAVSIDVTLEGPKLKASGNVRSELKPAPPAKPGEQGTDVKMPSMLKQDQPVHVLGEGLDYDGVISKGTYTGGARLFQGETTIKGESLVIDNKAGNLTASGGVTTTTLLDQTGTSSKDTKDSKDAKDSKDKKRSLSIATAKDFAYDDASRRMTYTTDAHMSGPNGDMTAARILLFLKPSGDELDRAEAYEAVVLREQNRETKGTKLIYTTDNETYVVTGVPVRIVDSCKRETTGETLTFVRGADSIVINGNAKIRTQTRGGNANCTS